MKNALLYLLAEVMISLTLAFTAIGAFNGEFSTMFGLINLILGIIGLVIGLIASIIRESSFSKGMLISSAILLLLGFLTCSVYPAVFH